MKRSMFGEPRPATFDEISEALDEIDLLPEAAQAQICDCRDEEAPFTGFTADISHADLGEPSISTCGFPDREELIAGLIDLGIVLIEDL
jgi:hypothetical protein